VYYYLVNNKRFNNIYLAQHESYRSGSPIQLYCNTKEYDKLDWQKEPVESLETLMDRHALKLREKYERLIFFWSGGTDSQTLYNVFVRNNIHLDEIVCIGNSTLKHMPASHWDWIRAVHQDPTTIITDIDKLDLSWRKQYVDNEDWVFKDLGDIRTFTNGGADFASTIMCERNHNGHNWAMISGHEKPYLIQKNGTWWTRQEDRPMRQIFGLDRIECFFLDPILNLKQSHMVKRAINQLPITLRDGDQAELIYPNGRSGYRAFAKACGRHDELAHGVSSLQKQVHKEFAGIIPSTTGGIKDVGLLGAEPILIERLRDDDPFAITYIKGLYNLIQDKPFNEYMNAFGLHVPGKVLNTIPVYSKPYNLGA